MNEFQFTCVSFDKLDLLIPRDYITAAFYMESLDEKNCVSYNGEILPHLNLSNLIQDEFKCSVQGQSDFALIINTSDWENDIRKKISERTSTEFPVSKNFALSFNTEVCNQIIKISEFSKFANGIQKPLKQRGILAIRFFNNKIQFLIALDFVVKEFLKSNSFSGTLLRETLDERNRTD